MGIRLQQRRVWIDCDAEFPRVLDPPGTEMKLHIFEEGGNAFFE